MTKHHLHKYVQIGLIILFFIGLFGTYIIPMTSLNQTIFLTHDGRWWLNQYYEFKQTFPNMSPVAFHGFNHVGLAINSLYPQTILKLIETPLILLNVNSPYIVMGSITILTMIIAVILLKTISNQLVAPEYTWILTFIALIIIYDTSTGFVNSTPQAIGLDFILLGVYAILNRPWLLTVATYGLLSTSLTTSVIGLITFAIVFFLNAYWEKFIYLFIAGVMGIIGAIPSLGYILRHVHETLPVYQGFAQDYYPTVFQSNHIVYLLIFMILILTIPLSCHYWKQPPYWLTIIVVGYVILKFFPHFTAILSTPIQPGTWTRTLPIFAIALMFWLAPFFESYPKNSILKTLFLVICALFTLPSYTELTYYINRPIHQSDYIQDQKDGHWDKVYNRLQSNFKIKIDHTDLSAVQSYMRNIRKISPDYIPKDATLHERTLAFHNQDYLKTHLALTKQVTNYNQMTIKLTTTDNKWHPLVVWSYPFINYHIQATDGDVMTKHGMFYFRSHHPLRATHQIKFIANY